MRFAKIEMRLTNELQIIKAINQQGGRLQKGITNTLSCYGVGCCLFLSRSLFAIRYLQ